MVSFTIAAALFLFYATHFFVARDLQDLDYGVPEVVAGVQFAAVPEQQGPVKPVVTHARLANPPNIVHTALFGKWDNCKNISLVRAATIEARLHARCAE